VVLLDLPDLTASRGLSSSPATSRTPSDRSAKLMPPFFSTRSHIATNSKVTSIRKAVVMSTHAHRLQKIRAHVRDAYSELRALPAEDRQAFESELARLDDVVVHAGAVLEAADSRHVSERAFAAIQSAAIEISNDPRGALQAPDAHADALIDAVALLPPTPNGVEQQVMAGAQDFQKWAADRLDGLRREVDTEAERLRRLGSEVEQCSSRLEQHADRQAAADRKLADAEKTIARQARALDEEAARQREAFAESERGRTTQFQALLDAFRAELARAQQEAVDEIDVRVAEIRRMEQETADVVGAIGLEATAEVYRRQGRRQQRAAEILRGLAVLACLGSVAIWLGGAAATNLTAESLLAGLFASLLLAGLAAYLARQSGRHRAREEHAAAVQLELAAFGPFIEPLSPERREEERVIMARKLFPAPKADAPPASPTLRRGQETNAHSESNHVPKRWSLPARPLPGLHGHRSRTAPD
jgi:hypothetical protein